jgi:hypothetical protein
MKFVVFTVNILPLLGHNVLCKYVLSCFMTKFKFEIALETQIRLFLSHVYTALNDHLV